MSINLDITGYCAGIMCSDCKLFLAVRLGSPRFSISDRQEKFEMSRQTITATELLVGLTLVVCVASIFEPRLRRACIGLLCRLT